MQRVNYVQWLPFWSSLESDHHYKVYFFRHFGGEPLTSQHFSYKLKECIRLLGLPSTNCSSHSFRIGAATSAVMAGMSDEQIKNMGRWRSSAFKQYIRPNHLISFT